jgi:hypothetical protein
MRSGSWFDVMQVCEKGHKVNDSTIEMPQYSLSYCKECGSKTITKCPRCNVEIRGFHHVPGVLLIHGPDVPEFCHGCGAPYPWQKAKETSFPGNPLDVVVNLLSRFHQVQRQMKVRQRNRKSLVAIADEYDVQDLLHALLKINFSDIRPEDWVPSYAGGTSRVDFLLKAEQVVIEAKFATNKLKDREVGEQLLVDIAKYEQHPDCKTLVCFVYDPDGRLANPVGLRSDLEAKSTEKLKVVAVVSHH